MYISVSRTSDNEHIAWFNFEPELTVCRREFDEDTRLETLSFYERDFTQITYRYPEGSIGAINGMNHPVTHIPNARSVQWYVRKIKLAIKEAEGVRQ
jgi:hypothetical protein